MQAKRFSIAARPSAQWTFADNLSVPSIADNNPVLPS